MEKVVTEAFIELVDAHCGVALGGVLQPYCYKGYTGLLVPEVVHATDRLIIVVL